MNRRDFLKTLLAVGAVSIAGINILDKENELLSLDEYPNIEYSKEWIPEKLSWLHTTSMRKGDVKICSCEYADYENLPPEIVNEMLIALRDYNNG